MGLHYADDFDLDIRLAPEGSSSGPAEAMVLPRTADTCATACNQATCDTCGATCQTCPATCQTCATQCNQATCAPTCQTCATQCNQATCAATCATLCNQVTCITCYTCNTCNPDVYTCGAACAQRPPFTLVC
jgi:hypothetical protein